MLKDVPTDQLQSPTKNSQPENHLEAARNLVNVLILTWKNYSIYPENHTAVLKSLDTLYSAFGKYFDSHKSLPLTVQKNQLLIESTVLYEGSSGSTPENLVSILFRDGIQWLKFLPGLEKNELVYFFSVLNRYKMLVEEPEGDVVTGLTDGYLEHIEFKAVEVFWENFPLLDFSNLDTLPPQESETDQQMVRSDILNRAAESDQEFTAKSIADPSVSQALWEVSPAEAEELRKMVQEEESWDNTEDVFDVLLVILQSQTDQYSVSSVLEFTLEEAAEAIRQDEYELLLRLFQALNRLTYKGSAAEFGWMRVLVDRFFQDLSSPEVFDHISEKLISLSEADTENILVLREVLLYFSPAIIHILGPVLLRTKFAAVQKMILDVMEYMCLRDLQPLEALLAQSDKRLGEMLLPLLSRLRGERSNRIFFKMIKHPSEQLRRVAVKVLLTRDPQLTLKLFPLIGDPSIAVRKDMLSVIAKQKSPVLENMLLKYIQENVASSDDSHIKACYEALGSCGSERIIPLLGKILINKGWNKYTGFGRPEHREGAASALLLLGGSEADQFLSKAAKSRFQIIRDACDRAMANIAAAGDQVND